MITCKLWPRVQALRPMVATLLVVTASIATGQGSAYPPPGYGTPQGQQGYGGSQGYAGQGQGQAQSLDQLMAWERQDMKVPARRTLQNAGSMHGPTPNEIPGGQVITTKGLVALMQGTQGVDALVFDVLGGPQQLPNAIAAVPASQAGAFNDQIQQQFGQMLQQLTRGSRDVPLVFYCQGPQCWMSYNAALRAINLGYRNVLWYRGGIEAWQRAGLPLAQQSQAKQGGPQGGGYQGAPQGGYGQPGGMGAQPGYGSQGGPLSQGGYGPQGGYQDPPPTQPGQPGTYPPPPR